MYFCFSLSAPCVYLPVYISSCVAHCASTSACACNVRLCLVLSVSAPLPLSLVAVSLLAVYICGCDCASVSTSACACVCMCPTSTDVYLDLLTTINMTVSLHVCDRMSIVYSMTCLDVYNSARASALSLAL